MLLYRTERGWIL